MFFEDADGKVIFKTNARIKAEGGKFNKDFFDWIQGVPRKQHEHPHGCVRKWFEPIRVNHVNEMVNMKLVFQRSIFYKL